jgi:hypothetical protein
MSSEQPQCVNVKQPTVKCGKTKQPQVQGGKSKQPQAPASEEMVAPTEKKKLTEEEIAIRSANMAAFFTSYIQECTNPSVAAQIAIMRFTDGTLSSDFGGKSFKKHIGPSYLRYLGEHLETVCELATSRFFELLRALPKAEQRSIIITVLKYFTTESMLSDEIGGDIPDSIRRKFHMLFLWGFQGIFYKRVCDYARRHLGAKITHKWYFKVDGQVVFGDEVGVPITPSLQTVHDKVTTIEASLAKKMKVNAEAVDKLEKERRDLAEKVKDLPEDKATRLKQRLDTIVVRDAELAVEQCALQSKLDHVHKLLLAIPKKVTPGKTAELFLKDENQFDDLSKHFGQNGIVLHTDPSLEIALPQSFDDIFELLAAEPKYDNTLLREINKQADAILHEHHIPKKSAYPTEGAVLHVTVTFPSPSDDPVPAGDLVPSDDSVPCDDSVPDGASVSCDAPVPGGITITCMLKLKNETMAPM